MNRLNKCIYEKCGYRVKIRKLKFPKHAVLKQIEFEFLSENAETLDLVILAGVNGSGKTQLLEAIYDHFAKIPLGQSSGEIEFEWTTEEKECIENYKNNVNTFFKQLINYQGYINQENTSIYIKTLKVLPKIIYLPLEVNFTIQNSAKDSYKYHYTFLNRIDSKFSGDVASFLATKVKLTQKENENLTYGQAKDAVAKEVNEIFEVLGLDIEMIGFTKDERDIPLFKNSSNSEFEMNSLSSGEKQLFLRALALKMVEPENSIILIDEPENSLHPKWQQKIVKVYQKLTNNCQLIIATHSPHILGSVNNESVRIMSMGKDGVEFKKFSDYTQGQSVKMILENVMKIESDIAPDIFEKFQELRGLLRKGDINTEYFNRRYLELRDLVGPLHEDIILFDIELQRQRKRG